MRCSVFARPSGYLGSMPFHRSRDLSRESPSVRTRRPPEPGDQRSEDAISRHSSASGKVEWGLPAAPVPVAGVALIALDPVQMGMDPGRSLVALGLDDPVGCVPLALALVPQGRQGRTQPFRRCVVPDRRFECLYIHGLSPLSPVSPPTNGRSAHALLGPDNPGPPCDADTKTDHTVKASRRANALAKTVTRSSSEVPGSDDHHCGHVTAHPVVLSGYSVSWLRQWTVFPCRGDGDGDQGVVSECRHGLEVARDSTVGVCEGYGSEAPGDLLLDLGHAYVALATIVCERSVGAPGKAQDVLSLDDEALVEVMGVGLGDRSALALFWRRDFGHLRASLLKDRLVASCDALVVSHGQPLLRAFG